MIRLPKLFKRNSETDFDGGSVRGRRNVNKLAPRSFQRAQESEELALTEDPEQQRARHRLIGAAVLVIIAVVGLPQILDSNPKSSNNDIAINIVTSLPVPNVAAPSVEGNVKPSADVTPKEKEVVSGTERKPEIKSDAKSVPAPTINKVNVIGLAVGEEVVASPNSNTKTEELPKKAGPGKYVIQIGAFASEERAQGWISKMKDQKIPNYVLNKTGADGVTLYVLRAGPFADKDTAEAAEKKVKAMGLTPRLVEVGTP